MTAANSHQQRGSQIIGGGPFGLNRGRTDRSDCVDERAEEALVGYLEALVIGIPTQFSLHYADGSPPRQCLIRGKTGTTLGVEFEEDDSPGA